MNDCGPSNRPKTTAKALSCCKRSLVELSMLLNEFNNAKYISLSCQVLILHLQGSILRLESIMLPHSSSIRYYKFAPSDSPEGKMCPEGGLSCMFPYFGH